MTTQEFVQMQVEQLAGGNDLLLLTDYFASNAGTWRMFEGSVIYARIGFDFQHQYVKLDCEGWHRTFVKDDVHDLVEALRDFVCAEV